MCVYCDMFILSVTLLPPYTTTLLLLLITCICWLLTKIFTLTEEEVETSEDFKLLLVKITGK